MPVNSIFHTSNSHAIATEQNLYRDLLAEAIQIFGHDVHYLDRTIVAEDTLLGEDTLSKFSSSAKIEMYVENAEGGYEGERELMNRFGLQNLSDVTFVVAKHRFQQLTKQITIESGTDTTGGAILLESGTIDMSSDAIVFEGETFYILNETDATDSDRQDLNLLRRSDSDLMGADVGYAVLQKNDSEGIYDSDSKVSPSITNLTVGGTLTASAGGGIENW